MSVHDRHWAFTLIELLVVVTIIVTLLALLTPALDRAIYQSELVLCGATNKAIVNPVSLYAMDYRRHYPNRTGADEPHKIARGGGDDRPKLRPYMSLNDSLIDTFAGQIDIDASDPDTNIYSNYTLWFGWKYTGHAAMSKVGSRFTWTDHETGQVHAFTQLSSDWEQFHFLGRDSTMGGHPDRDGVLGLNEIRQDDDAFLPGVVPSGSGAIKFTISRWTASNDDRGTIDRNFGYADGSVERLADLVLEDPRTEPVPYVPSPPSPTLDWRHYLPAK